MSTNNYPVLIVATLLLVAVFILSVIVSTSGPRISRTQLAEDPTLQQYSMEFTTVLREADLQINPQIKHEIELNDRLLTVNFLEPLHYATKYELTIDVIDERDKLQQLTSQFITREPELYYLQRQSGREMDYIRSTSLQAEEDDTVYEHPEIVFYAIGRDGLISVVNEGDQQTRFIRGNHETALALPIEAKVIHVQGSSKSNRYAFTLQTPDFENEGWMFNADDTTWQKVTGDVGSSLLGSRLILAPDGQTVAYFDAGRSLIIDNPSDNEAPLTLGVFDGLQRFLPNESALLTVRSNKYNVLNSQSGQIEDAPSVVRSGARAQLFNNRQDYVFISRRLDDTRQDLIQFVQTYLDEATVELLSHPSNERLITGLELSPNDEYVVVQEVPQPAVYDNVDGNNSPTYVLSRLMNIKSGESVRLIEGFDLQWR